MSPRRHRRLCEWAYLFLFPLVAITTAIGCGGGDDDDENETDDDAIDDDSIDDDTGDDDVADDDTTDDDTMDDDTFDDDATDDDTGDDDTDDTFVNFFLSDADTGEEIEGATCTLVDPVSGEPDDPAIEELSDADGVCAFVLDGDPAQVSVRFEWADYVTIYRFYVETNSVVDQIMVSEALRDTIAVDVGATLDPLDGIVFGLVQWAGGTGVENVGCAEVTHDAGDGDLFYTDDTGYPTNARTDTSPIFSAFLVFNVPPGGPYLFEADTDGDVTETSANKVFAQALTFIILSYREEDWPDNPTPGGCT